jgi:oligoendopeptidase F
MVDTLARDTAPPSWRLDDLYAGPADPRIGADLDAAREIAADLADRYRGRVAGLAPSDVDNLLTEHEEALRLLQQVDGYLELLAASDEPVDAALATRCDATWAAVVEHVGFIEAELTALDAGRLAALRGNLALVRHEPVLSRVATADDRLPAGEERALARLAVTGQDGWARLGQQLLARVAVELDGRRVGIAAAMAALHDPDADVRGRAHEATSRALEPEIDLRATALGMIATGLAIRTELRGQPSWLSERHQLNQVTAAEVDRLLDVAGGHLDLAHEWFAAKAGVLGGCRDADRYAPVGAEPGPRIDWPDACDLVVGVFAAVDDRLGEQARSLLAGGHVDAAPRPGKSVRPFTRAVTPDRSPFVSLTFTGRTRDVLTLAHELGHAVHLSAAAPAGVFGGVPQPVLAETAALFFEGLAAQRVGAALTEPAERVGFLGRQLETRLAAPLRQVVLHRFEDRLHRHAATAGPPGTAELSAWWLDSNRQLYGDAVTFGPDFGLWWSCLDSVVTAPGSLYGYVYGGLAAHVLLDRYRDQPADGRDRLLALMAAGSVRPPAEVMRLAGVDTTDAACWERGFGSLRELLAEFRAAAKELPGAVDAGHSGRPGGAQHGRR